MLLIRLIFPAAFFALIAGILFIIGMGFEWSSLYKAVMLNLFIALLVEFLLGKQIMSGIYKNRTLIVPVLWGLAGFLFWYSFGFDSKIPWSAEVDVARAELEFYMVVMATAGQIFTFGGMSLFKRE